MSETLEEKFALTASRGFTEWLARAGGSLAFTTYQAGKLFLVGLRPDGTLSVHERTFARCMGLAVSDNARTLLLASHYQLYRFDSVLPRGPGHATAETVYVPRMSWITGDLDIHDVAFDASGRPVFVNTLFSCIATASDGASFKPLWRPSFISKLAPEDRCHLNGMAMWEGTPMLRHRGLGLRRGGRLARQARRWRHPHRNQRQPARARRALHAAFAAGVRPQAVAFELRHRRARLRGFDAQRFEPIAFCPGYARGLAFADGCAVVGLSLPRENRTFQGLPLDAALKARNTEARCGLVVVDLTSGDTVAWVRLEGIVRELYDVAFLPGVRSPAAIGFKTDEILRIVTIDEG